MRSLSEPQIKGGVYVSPPSPHPQAPVGTSHWLSPTGSQRAEMPHVMSSFKVSLLEFRAEQRMENGPEWRQADCEDN